jgi:hypothetical protein
MPASDRLRTLVAEPLARQVVTTLLARAAQPGRSRVVRFHVNADTLAAYFDPRQVRPRTEANQALQALATAGFLQLN